jgi:glycosyltransferase involved in cell wall biosynthesis
LINNKITIGYIFENSPKGGGIFQTEISTGIRLKNLDIENFDIKFFSTNKNNLDILSKKNFKVEYINKKDFGLNFIKFYNLLTSENLKKLINYLFKFDSFEKKLISNKVDFVHFNQMSTLALMLKKIDYGVSFWDMAHLDYSVFPESKSNYHSISAREYIYKTLSDSSFYIVTDCQENKSNFLKRFSIVRDKISIVYSEPSSQLIQSFKQTKEVDVNIIEKLDLKNKEFIFYPAQYWAHKNHVYILEAIHALKTKHNKIIKTVFCGAEKNNLDYLISVAGKLGIQKEVIFLNFLNEEEIFNLYKNSFAIVVPTYFGPTNHLPIEGFYFEKPVLYSDIWSETEQVKGGVIKIDLKNPEDLADKLLKLSTDSSFLEDYKLKAKEKYKEITIKIDKSQNTFKKLFESYRTLKKNFKN